MLQVEPHADGMRQQLAGHLVGQVPGIAGSGFCQAEALFEWVDDGFDPACLQTPFPPYKTQ